MGNLSDKVKPWVHGDFEPVSWPEALTIGRDHGDTYVNVKSRLLNIYYGHGTRSHNSHAEVDSIALEAKLIQPSGIDSTYIWKRDN